MSRLRPWARALRRDAVALSLAARDPRVPRRTRILAGAVVAYAFSPIDLIPDFIPVLGLLDDLLIVPGGVWLVVRSIPAPVMADLRRLAEAQGPPVSRRGAAAIVAVWLAFAGLATWLVIRAFA